MKVINVNELSKDRVINCPKEGFISHRILLDTDNMGYTMTKTIVPVGEKQFWHYKHHLESCYCVSGRGELTNAETGEVFEIKPDFTYVLDNNDKHYFQAFEEVVLICVFNPPLTGDEVHNETGVYDLPEYMSPVYNVKRVHIDKIKANDYNPNAVAPPEMALLETSIWEDGYTQPVVVVRDPGDEKYTVVDGFHRFRTLKESKRIRERENEMLPVVVLNKEMHDRMASTIRHNRARGTHNIELMSTIVAELVEMGKGDTWISNHIGMSKDELLRLKQITGVAALFKNKDFSDSWDVVDDENEGEEI